ncbi:histidine phosphatase family protein [Priestia taiwanensis]|uniref:Phosphoglycerate mutase n=1 Tax=Priestia taiwanensis TaxID=1347902 RepID=A0A917ASG2_9BACI|nr:histidine phosphatase family protein [Priestia taiwanensis]MBM7363978.1 2,3-bisphosphoglycerate-dependent phosphoglycerate mutase [Priestia taiwanensis]GGE70672.1 phosphoglycerate mutase [Priestia taiwanensis]
METNIYFIRHADSPFIFGQERERPLSEEGVQSAKRVVESLKNIPFDAVFSSPYIRAIQTLDGLIDPATIVIEENLRERALKGDYRLPEEKREHAHMQSFGDVDFCLEGGEALREAQYRSLPIIFHILENQAYQHVAIGTHGNIMTTILHYFDSSFDYTFWKSTEKPDIYQATFSGFHLLRVQKREY